MCSKCNELGVNRHCICGQVWLYCVVCNVFNIIYVCRAVCVCRMKTHFSWRPLKTLTAWRVQREECHRAYISSPSHGYIYARTHTRTYYPFNQCFLWLMRLGLWCVHYICSISLTASSRSVQFRFICYMQVNTGSSWPCTGWGQKQDLQHWIPSQV